MRAFRYRLAAVLSRAEHAERMLQIELARRQDELADLDHQIGSVRTLQRELQTHVRDAFAATRERLASVDMAPLQSLQQAMEDAEVLETHIMGLRQGIVEQIGEIRQRLLEAARSRRMLQKHREDLAERHRRAQTAAETKQLDELATNAAAREQLQERAMGLEEPAAET